MYNRNYEVYYFQFLGPLDIGECQATYPRHSDMMGALKKASAVYILIKGVPNEHTR